MIHITCAIIERDGKILITQRNANKHLGLKWEFPGGKIENNESPEDCIVREIKEELCISIIPVIRLDESIYDYGSQMVKLIPFVCNYGSGEMFLTEHAAALWVDVESILNYDWCEADLPVIDTYLKHMNTVNKNGI